MIFEDKNGCTSTEDGFQHKGLNFLEENIYIVNIFNALWVLAI